MISSAIFKIISLLRIKQWVKNLFIFFPLFFAGEFTHPGLILNATITFFAFCLTASGIYVFNDFIDAEKDRFHPKKSQRPLSQGSFNKSFIVLLIIALLVLGLWTAWIAGMQVFWIAITYVLVNIFYNLYAKRVVLLDVFFVAMGFQFRIWSGSAACDIIPSVWLQLCVFLLALFLGFAKRRYEIATLKDKASEHRSVLAHYTAYLLDQIIIICSTLAIVFYGLYTISSDIVKRIGNYNMAYTLVFVIYGIFRYLYLIHVRKMGDEPGELLFLDKPLFFNIFLWIASIGLILYL